MTLSPVRRLSADLSYVAACFADTVLLSSSVCNADIVVRTLFM